MMKPKAKPVWTAWSEAEDGVSWARVRLDVGQFSFRAGIEIRSSEEFPEKVARLISAITVHAQERGWI